MIGCLQTRVRKQSIIALYFEFEAVLKFYNLEARAKNSVERYRVTMASFLTVDGYVPDCIMK